MKILHIIPSLAPGGLARRLRLLATHLPREAVVSSICCLGPEVPWAAELRQHGVEVACLGWRRRVDLGPWMALRRLLRVQKPEVLHVWGQRTLRTVALSTPRPRHLLVTGAVRLGRSSHLPTIDQLLIQNFARAVLVTGPAEVDACRHSGLAANLLVEVPDAVEPMPTNSERQASGGRKPPESPPSGLTLHSGGLRPPLANSAPVWTGVPPGDRVIACVGPLQPYKGFPEAIWAFDILRFVRHGMHLVFVGVGTDEPALRLFAQQTQSEAQVQFVGSVAEVGPILARADMVWIPSRTDCGHGAALEAMAAGCPVIASNFPGLAERIGDGGVLIPPRDPASLARAARRLLDDPKWAQSLGEAGRQRVEERYRVETIIERYLGLLGSLAR